MALGGEASNAETEIVGMSVRVEERDDVACVIAEGMFTGGTETIQLQATLADLIDDPRRRKVLLNLTGTRLMLSVAIGALVAANARAREREILFYVCGLRPALKIVFDTFQIGADVLTSFDSCDEAFEALRRA